MERRKGIRYRMKASVVFNWKRSRGERFQGAGMTRDVSVYGVFVLSPTCPPVDSIIQMDVVLPPQFSENKTRIKSEMRVLRVEHDVAGKGRSGFSAVGKGFALRAISNHQSYTRELAENREEQK